MLRLTALALLLLPVVLLSQSPVRPVRVNVIVSGKDGPATDLSMDDFTLLDQGKPRVISFFSVDKPSTEAPKGGLPPNTFSNRISKRGAPPSNLTVILFDGLNTAAADQPYARQQIIRFLKQLTAGSRVALYGLGDSLTVLQDFTGDAAGLDSMIDEVDGVMAKHAPGERVLPTCKALEAIAGHVGQIPGRKSLLWVAGGFPVAGEECPRTFRALNSAGIAMYPVDARERPGKQTASASMLELAASTGGHAFASTNDLVTALNKAIADASVTYTLGFYPAPEDLDGKLHNLTIQLKRKGLNVRYRRGYMAFRDESPERGERESMIETALWSPLSTSGISLACRVERVERPEPDLLQLVVAADAHQMRLRMQDERWTGKLEVVFTQQDRDGEILDSKRDTVNLDLQASTYATVLQKGMLFGQVLKPNSRLAQVRVVIYDYASGQLGSLVIPVEQLTGITQ